MLAKEIIDVKTLSREIFEGVLFLSLAEGGAMGTPGEIIVVNKKPAAYSMQCVFGDIKYDDIEALFPVMGQCRFGIFGLNSEVPNGWNYVYLGMGNHLIVADEAFDEFRSLTKECKRDLIIMLPGRKPPVWWQECLTPARSMRSKKCI